MKPIFVTFVVSIFSVALLSAQVSTPRVGFARFSDGTVRAVQGLPANLIVSQVSLASADTVSFSDFGGLIAQNGVIRLLNSDASMLAEYPSGDSTPLLSMSGDLTTALVWLPSKHTLLHWSGESFTSVEVDDSAFDGVVTSVSPSGAKLAKLLVSHSDGSVEALTVSLRTGNLVSAESVPGVQGAAYTQRLYLVFASDQELVVDSMDGYRRSIPLPAKDLKIERMASDWLHLWSPTTKQDWALHVTSAELDVSRLPTPREVQSSILSAAAQGVR